MRDKICTGWSSVANRSSVFDSARQRFCCAQLVALGTCVLGCLLASCAKKSDNQRTTTVEIAVEGAEDVEIESGEWDTIGDYARSTLTNTAEAYWSVAAEGAHLGEAQPPLEIVVQGDEQFDLEVGISVYAVFGGLSPHRAHHSSSIVSAGSGISVVVSLDEARSLHPQQVCYTTTIIAQATAISLGGDTIGRETLDPLYLILDETGAARIGGVEWV